MAAFEEQAMPVPYQFAPCAIPFRIDPRWRDLNAPYSLLMMGITFRGIYLQ